MADAVDKRLSDAEGRIAVLEALVDHLLGLSHDRPETTALRRRLEGMRDNSGDEKERDLATRVLARLGP